jgi:GntR family transcriptional regulator
MLRYANNVPIYARIAAVVRQRIDNGELVIGSMLPTLEALMSEFDASRVTLRLAMDTLAAEGLIERRRGFGTLVIARPHNAREVSLPMRWRELIERLDNVKREITDVVCDVQPSPEEINDVDGLTVGRSARYARMVALHCHDGRAYCHVNSWIAQTIYAKSERALKTQPALLVLQRHYRERMASVRQTLTIGLADLSVAKAVAVPLGSPIALIRRSVDDPEGVRIYAAQLCFPANVVRIETTLLPE